MYSMLWFNLVSTLNFIFTFSMHYHTLNITTLYIKKQSQIKIKPRKKINPNRYRYKIYKTWQ